MVGLVQIHFNIHLVKLSEASRRFKNVGALSDLDLVDIGVQARQVVAPVCAPILTRVVQVNRHAVEVKVFTLEYRSEFDSRLLLIIVLAKLSRSQLLKLVPDELIRKFHPEKIFAS